MKYARKFVNGSIPRYKKPKKFQTATFAMMMTLHACKPVDNSLPTPAMTITVTTTTNVSTMTNTTTASTANNVSTATIVVYTAAITATTTVMTVMMVMNTASTSLYMDGYAVTTPATFVNLVTSNAKKIATSIEITENPWTSGVIACYTDFELVL